MNRQSALNALEAARERLATAQQEVTDAVAAARSEGATWAAIGEVMGMSRQAAHERWGHYRRGGCHQRGCDCPHHQSQDCQCGHGPGSGYRAKNGQTSPLINIQR